MSVPSEGPRETGPINSQRLLYFVRVADAGSLTAAAASIGIAQPSLSAALRKLESELGLELFTRRGRGVALTEEGLQLVEHARTAIEGINRFADAASSLSADNHGTVSVAAPAGVSISVLGPLASAFAQRHVDSQLRTVRTYGLVDTIDAVRRGHADLALLPRLAVPDGLEGFSVGFYELALALPGRVRLPAGAVRPAQLSGLPFIASHPGTVADRLLQTARRHGARPHITMIEPDIGLLPQLVARGVGAAVVTTALTTELRALDVEMRLFEPRERWPVRLVYRPDSLTSTSRRFVAVASEFARGAPSAAAAEEQRSVDIALGDGG